MHTFNQRLIVGSVEEKNIRVKYEGNNPPNVTVIINIMLLNFKEM